MRYLKLFEDLDNLDIGSPKFLFTIGELDSYFDVSPLHHLYWSEDFIEKNLIGKKIRLLSSGVYLSVEKILTNIKHPQIDVYYFYFGTKTTSAVIGLTTKIGVYDEISEEAKKVFNEIRKRKTENRFDL